MREEFAAVDMETTTFALVLWLFTSLSERSPYTLLAAAEKIRTSVPVERWTLASMDGM